MQTAGPVGWVFCDEHPDQGFGVFSFSHNTMVNTKTQFIMDNGHIKMFAKTPLR